jgi:hypothetical protein
MEAARNQVDLRQLLQYEPLAPFGVRLAILD